jgi:hypothetical protein
MSSKKNVNPLVVKNFKFLLKKLIDPAHHNFFIYSMNNRGNFRENLIQQAAAAIADTVPVLVCSVHPGAILRIQGGIS